MEKIIKKLKSVARPDQLEGMAKFGLAGKGRLGVSVPEMRKLAKEIGKDHDLAQKLWKAGFQETRILASMIDLPQQVTEKQMDAWVKDIDSWDVCDQLCGNLFDKTEFTRKKIIQWSENEEEFIKRTAFSLIAYVAVHDKKAPDDDFISLIPIIKKGSLDERNYVKKAVNWALRSIGKRNLSLNKIALEAAYQIRALDTKAARWVAADAIRELESDKVLARLKKKTKT